MSAASRPGRHTRRWRRRPRDEDDARCTAYLLLAAAAALATLVGALLCYGCR